MMMAAAAPDDVGIVAIAGSPLSYWAGLEGINPMRYTGGLLGGTWLTSLMGDLGNGKFDGAYLVQNFESLNPSNTLWGKPYNLYSKVDTEESRYLGFEKWWSGYFFTTKDEMRFITDELFVGNKLTGGTIQTSDRRRIDLRNIRSPIVVIASWGDNITPPPQALNWIPDLYDSVDEIRAHEQVIVYTLDQRIGHLGIFVSAKVAEKQHAEIVNTIDLIGSLPPGLYEMIIDEKRPEDIGVDLLPGHYLVRFEARTVQDILALDDGREDEQAFETVARFSEINEGLYETFVSPWIRPFVNDATRRGAARDASAPARAVHDLRHEPDALAAQGDGRRRCAQNRRQVAPDNPLVKAEHAVSQQIEQSLDRYRDLRDRGQEVHVQDDLQLAAGRGARRAARALCRCAQAARPRRACRADPRGQDRRDQDARGAGRLRGSRAAHHARGRAGRAHVRRARLPARAADQAGASGAAAHPARADPGRGQGGGVHAALRSGAGARRAAADAAERGASGARPSISCAGSATPTARSRRRARPCSRRSSAFSASIASRARPSRRPARAKPSARPGGAPEHAGPQDRGAQERRGRQDRNACPLTEPFRAERASGGGSRRSPGAVDRFADREGS